MIISGITAFFTGTLGWTFTEYTMHRFMAHHGKPRGRFGREHLAHHAQPDSFTPVHIKIAVAIPIATVIFAVAFSLLPTVLASLFTTGFLGTYLAYELLHWSLHIFAPRTGYGRWARSHHFAHHFENANYNHGVTSPLWDHIFGTLMQPTLVRVPRRFAPVWLCEDDGEIRSHYLDNYILRHRPTPPQTQATPAAVR